MGEHESAAQIVADKAWHRANHEELDPTYLKLYLGYRFTKIIKETFK